VVSDEGLLRDHRYHDGRYWDEHVLSMSPDQLMGLASVLPPVGSTPFAGPSNPVLMLPSHDVFLQRIRSALWDDRSDRLEMDTQLSEVNLDSLDIVALVLSVEELIGQQVEPRVALSWKTPTDIYEYAISSLVGSHSLAERP
jgi:acyl carrier protein